MSGGWITSLHRNVTRCYDTILNDKVNLSAGQKQQLTIARAMLKQAPM